MLNYLLSVDGGGTKTEFCLCDLDGKEIGKILTGSSNYKSVGSKECYQNLEKGFQLLEQEYKISRDEIAYSVFGISGCDSRADYDVISEQIGKLGLAETKVYLCNDAILAFYARAKEPGIVIIAGTGSIVIGVGESGDSIRAGGWGYNFSDVGSGYWIGCEALKKTLLYCDGCIPYSDLYDGIRKKVQAESFEELPYIVTNITDNFEIAKMAKVVVEQAEAGNEVAVDILKEGGKSLADLVKGVCDKLSVSDVSQLPIVFSGGTLQSTFYLKLLKEAIEEKLAHYKLEFLSHTTSPVYGGIQLAKRRTAGGGADGK